ncbi:MAG: hypothetical protein K9K75_07090 [Deltaproteobacteria bacterium]|nr:hypothetical protein [Deltaproteobacteria bacterium]
MLTVDADGSGHNTELVNIIFSNVAYDADIHTADFIDTMISNGNLDIL